MANTFDSDLYGKAISDGAIRVLQNSLKPLSSFSVDFSPAPAQQYETVRVPKTADPAAVQDKSIASNYTIQDTTVSESVITLNTHKYVTWKVEDVENIKGNWYNIENVGIEKAQKLAIAVFQDILSVVTASNYGSNDLSDGTGDVLTVTSAAFDRDDVSVIAEACDNENWPDTPRNLLLSPSYYRAITRDGIVTADNYGDADIVRNSTDGFPLDGFMTWNCNAIPGNSENLTGFAARPDAIACAMRYLPPVGGGQAGSVYRPITHAETGATFGFRMYYDDDLGAMKAILECLYGYAVGEANSIKRIVSA